MRVMLDDFFIRALLGGIGMAIVAAPLGCFIVWRRMAYFGDTLAHSALLGVALAFLLEVNIMLAVFVISTLIALAMLALQRGTFIGSDAILGLLSHSSLAIGLVVLAFMTWVRIDLMGILFGDILAINRMDLLVIYAGGALVLGLLIWIWRPLFAATVNEELAAAEGYDVRAYKLVFMVTLAAVIAVSMKLIGVLLITALLIIPAVAARQFSRSPEQMVVIAALLGVVSTVGGLYGSLTWDTPSGPSIVVAALLCFLASLVTRFKRSAG